MPRLDHLKRFYRLLSTLEERLAERANCTITPAVCRGRNAASISSGKPARSHRQRHRTTNRVRRHTRLEGRIPHYPLEPAFAAQGTNALRRRQSRGSIFRLIVGTALIERDELYCPTWDTFWA